MINIMCAYQCDYCNKIEKEYFNIGNGTWARGNILPNGWDYIESTALEGFKKIACPKHVINIRVETKI